jgi:hypothetical protein
MGCSAQGDISMGAALVSLLYKLYLLFKDKTAMDTSPDNVYYSTKMQIT